MKEIASFLESTYLKTADEASVTERQNEKKAIYYVKEAIKWDCAVIMIRQEYLRIAKDILNQSSSSVRLGTVIDFPFGDESTSEKKRQAKKAIQLAADELDFVADYNSFKRGDLIKFENDIDICTGYCLNNRKVVKWIIETGALSNIEISRISELIADIVNKNFPKKSSQVFLKTSTGYYGGFGATIKDVKLMKSVSKGLPIKASGGVSNLGDALKMIEAGATRIGTSKAINILNDKNES